MPARMHRRRIALGQKTVDLDTHRIAGDGREVCLTPTENTLLEYLVSRLNRTVPSEDLVRAVWGDAEGKGVHSLRVFIKTLRKKLEPVPAKPRYLVTEPRIGYRLQHRVGNS